MKIVTTLALAVCLMVSSSTFAQKTAAQEKKAPAKTEQAAAANESAFTKAKLNFHKFMSATFHPAEDGNFEPIRKMSGDLAKAAADWSKVEIKDKDAGTLSPEEAHGILSQLAEKTAQLNADLTAKPMDNDNLKKRLTEIHEIFHQIVEKCQPEEKKK